MVRQADDAIVVAVSELQDPAGLQRTPAADGVPASVTFTGRGNPACQGYPGGGSQSQRRQLLSGIVTVPVGSSRNAMIIHPAVLPSGAGLLIAASVHPGPRGGVELTVGLVQASPQCTGS